MGRLDAHRPACLTPLARSSIPQRVEQIDDTRLLPVADVTSESQARFSPLGGFSMDCVQSVFSFDSRASTRWIDERPATRRVHKTSIIVDVAIDFAQQRRFNLAYKDRDNIDKMPICIHRAPLGTHERFIGFLIEHYAGNFPLWLSPEQVRILTIGDDPKLMDYARSILNELRAHQVRAEIDKSTDNINGNIQRAEQMKVHTMFVIGKRDMEANAVSVRVHGKENLGT
jgi:prolyl-tRNA synthetase